MLDIIKNYCERPAEVSYYLGKNRAECQAIAGMVPSEASIAIKNIEARISPAPAPTRAARSYPGKLASSAPEPFGAGSGSGSVITRDPEKMSQAEYEQWRSGESGGVKRSNATSAMDFSGNPGVFG
jgi:hypothetical protein